MRLERSQITCPPTILEIYIVDDKKNRMTQPSDIQCDLMINGFRYDFAGAMLSNGKTDALVHFRALSFVRDGKYLVSMMVYGAKEIGYNGMRGHMSLEGYVVLE